MRSANFNRQVKQSRIIRKQKYDVLVGITIISRVLFQKMRPEISTGNNQY
jgi:hypothetical protein